jgi:hypothetical protein
MKCERHSWDTTDWEWCWRCEELTIEENKRKYEDKLRNNSLQRINGNKETSTISFGLQKTGGRDSDSL